jgi:hypothetical protein
VGNISNNMHNVHELLERMRSSKKERSCSPKGTRKVNGMLRVNSIVSKFQEN